MKKMETKVEHGKKDYKSKDWRSSERGRNKQEHKENEKKKGICHLCFYSTDILDHDHTADGQLHLGEHRPPSLICLLFLGFFFFLPPHFIHNYLDMLSILTFQLHSARDKIVKYTPQPL